MLLFFWKNEVYTTALLIFFLLKMFLYYVNGIRFSQSDDRSEVGICMEWYS